MHLKIETTVPADHITVRNGFDQELFKHLNPPFPPVRLLRFDGCQANDRVILELNFLFFTQRWESLITSNEEDANGFSFVDEGVKLPFFLKTWRHRHIVKSLNQQSIIIDDITFTSPFRITNWLLYPILYAQFLYRKPIYRKVFSR